MKRTNLFSLVLILALSTSMVQAMDTKYVVSEANTAPITETNTDDSLLGNFMLQAMENSQASNDAKSDAQSDAKQETNIVATTNWNNLFPILLGQVLEYIDFDFSHEMGATYANATAACKNWKIMIETRRQNKFCNASPRIFSLTESAAHGFPVLVAGFLNHSNGIPNLANIKACALAGAIKGCYDHRTKPFKARTARRIVSAVNTLIIQGLNTKVTVTSNDNKTETKVVRRPLTNCTMDNFRALDQNFLVTIAMLTPLSRRPQWLHDTLSASPGRDCTHTLRHLCHDPYNAEWLEDEEGLHDFLTTTASQNCVNICNALLHDPKAQELCTFDADHIKFQLKFNTHTPAMFDCFMSAYLRKGGIAPNDCGEIVLNLLEKSNSALVEHLIAKYGKRMKSDYFPRIGEKTAIQRIQAVCTQAQKQAASIVILIRGNHEDFPNGMPVPAEALEKEDLLKTVGILTTFLAQANTGDAKEVKQAETFVFDRMTLPELKQHLENKTATPQDFDKTIGAIDAILRVSPGTREDASRYNELERIIVKALISIAPRGDIEFVRHIITTYGIKIDERQPVLQAVQTALDGAYVGSELAIKLEDIIGILSK